jgi:hypothetical protein
LTSAAAVGHNAPNTSILQVSSTDIISQLGSQTSTPTFDADIWEDDIMADCDALDAIIPSDGDIPIPDCFGLDLELIYYHLNPRTELTSHAIIFGGSRYGGLGLPDLYTDQGYGQLKLLVGHLKLRDETGNLVLIAISHIQIHVGSGSKIFALPYPHYAKWVEQNWLTSI